MAANEKMQEHLQQFIDAGAGLEELEAELERLGLMDEETQLVDEDGSLVLWLADEDAETTTSQRHYWNIRDAAAGDPEKARSLAEWVLRKLLKAEKSQTDAQAAYDLNLAQMKTWLKRFATEAERTTAFAETALSEYMLDFHPDEKTLPMIAVEKLRWTKERDHIVWDEAGALAWALESDHVDVAAPRSLSKSGTKGLLEKRADGYYDSDTGEKVAFVRDDPPERPVRFEIVRGKS